LNENFLIFLIKGKKFNFFLNNKNFFIFFLINKGKKKKKNFIELKYYKEEYFVMEEI
jgi:hypothetical protein